MTIEQQLAEKTLKFIRRYFRESKEWKSFEYWNGQTAEPEIQELYNLAIKIKNGNSNHRNRKKTAQNETIRA